MGNLGAQTRVEQESQGKQSEHLVSKLGSMHSTMQQDKSTVTKHERIRGLRASRPYDPNKPAQQKGCHNMLA
jgi:hypothetical protein